MPPSTGTPPTVKVGLPLTLPEALQRPAFQRVLIWKRSSGPVMKAVLCRSSVRAAGGRRWAAESVLGRVWI